MYTNLPTSQGYIFRILQHFATKLCSFSNFDNFFPKISFVIPRLKIFLKRKSSINIRFCCKLQQFCCSYYSTFTGQQIVVDFRNVDTYKSKKIKLHLPFLFRILFTISQLIQYKTTILKRMNIIFSL
jgi:hypothetical protein